MSEVKITKKQEIKGSLNLKEMILDWNDEPVKNYNKIEPFKKDQKTGQMVQKTREEMDKEAPIYTIGEILAGALMHGCTPGSPSESAQLNRLAKTVQNKITTNKGIWDIDMNTIDTILKFLSFMDKEKSATGAQLTLGAVVDKLELARFEIQKEQNKRDLE